jgi:hypothetical protein
MEYPVAREDAPLIISGLTLSDRSLNRLDERLVASSSVASALSSACGTSGSLAWLERNRPSLAAPVRRAATAI